LKSRDYFFAVLRKLLEIVLESRFVDPKIKNALNLEVQRLTVLLLPPPEALKGKSKITTCCSAMENLWSWGGGRFSRYIAILILLRPLKIFPLITSFHTSELHELIS